LKAIAGSDCLEGVLVLAGVARHVRAGAAHVEADDWLAACVRGRCVGDYATSGPAENGPAASEVFH